ncbi:hypothetical protein [Chitinimonas taiwanensis]|uniref:Uncharacterized protein n=1 Tax=Chitinimonas taiwanensis DSM 18899 TaxID=1121279 RepID=A0A1K2HK16_9NEIS|nr:hypothetical protein [Chitinimonas taiwanensis]SFZ77168.1 hypothetical protein SAMN02745887_02259 [Chitinimonas taiwanensis DSM 18899]
MKEALPLLPGIKLPLLCGLVSVLLSISLMIWAQHTRQVAEQRLQQREATAHAAEANIQTAQSLQTERTRHLAVLTTLQQRGLLGQEQRLAWAEAVDALQRSGRLASLQLELGPRRPLNEANGATQAELQFYASPLKLDSKLLHEGDLLSLLRQLDTLPGAYTLDACRLRRSDGTNGPRPYRLALQCQGKLFTLARPDRSSP